MTESAHSLSSRSTSLCRPATSRCSTAQYYQQLNRLIDRNDALALDPLLVKRLRKMRAARQRTRSARRPGIDL